LGAIVAAFSKKGENIIPKVVRMLNELQHRGNEAHGIATPNSIEIARSIREIKEISLRSNVAVGHNFSQILPTDSPQPIENQDVKLVFEGRIFPPLDENEAQEILKRNGKGLEEKAENILRMDGSYAFVLLADHKIALGRDAAGLMPLYYGENDKIYAFASERKALWAANIWNVKSFPPGNLAVIDKGEITFKPIKTILKPSTRYISMDRATEQLHSLLAESTCERVQSLDKVAVAFSGGLDSSVIAFFTKNCDVKTYLIYVGMENNLETSNVEQIARFLGLPLQMKTFTENDVEKVLSKVLWLVEEPDVLKVSVAIPFYWTAEIAHKMGLNVLLAGQGGDELFGGYYRYLREYAQSGVKGLEDALYHDVVLSYKVNFERDNKVCMFHNVELRLPFVDYDLTLFALGLPVNLKIESKKDMLRKKVLREVAKRIGLPPAVYNMRKKAIQYSTGVNKALQNIAKRKGLSLRRFIKEEFSKTIREKNKIFNRLKESLNVSS